MMLDAFKEHIDKDFPFLRGEKLLLANSGGIDSVVLTYLCLKMGLDISLAHCNFNLRGKESDGDEDFVTKLGVTWNLEVFVENFDTKDFAKKSGLSTQVAARDLRYQWFKELADTLDYKYILTAHHLDDNLETFIINFTRGTGLDGLTGIPAINGNVVRPMLQFSREQIEVFAIENNLSWRDDSTNASTEYLRNKLRHDVIPTLKNIAPKLLDNFKKTTNHLSESRSIIDDRIAQISNILIKKKSRNTLNFNIEEIVKLINPKAYMYELFKDYGFTEWDDITGLLNSQSGKVVYSPNYRLIRDRDNLILSLRNDTDDISFKVENVPVSLDLPDGIIAFSKVTELQHKSSNVGYWDFDKLTFPLTLRHWQKGDYFYPFGMNGRKKLSKYFKDEKFSMLDKEYVWLLTSNDEIIWVIGKRTDDRYKVTDTTKTILKAEFKPV